MSSTWMRQLSLKTAEVLSLACNTQKLKECINANSHLWKQKSLFTYLHKSSIHKNAAVQGIWKYSRSGGKNIQVWFVLGFGIGSYFTFSNSAYLHDSSALQGQCTESLTITTNSSNLQCVTEHEDSTKSNIVSQKDLIPAQILQSTGPKTSSEATSADPWGIKCFCRTLGELKSVIDSETIKAASELRKELETFTEEVDKVKKCAKSLFTFAFMHGHILAPSERKKIIEKGLEICWMGLNHDENDALLHKWYALLRGLYIDFQSLWDRMSTLPVFKKHLEIAADLDPTDPEPYSCLGRLSFEIYSLPWIVRKNASLLFSEPPQATPEEALEYLLKAENLQPGFRKTNSLFIARCYREIGDNNIAKNWLLKAKEIPICVPEDKQSEREIEELLSKL